LGVVDDTAWDQGVAWLGRGESLVLYTDGVTDAQGPDGSAFGQERLLSSAQEHLGTSAQRMQQALLAEIHGFMQDCPQYDDLTLMVLARS
jgi:serine phosphatase RsbU (regulator of sigma subunit)